MWLNVNIEYNTQLGSMIFEVDDNDDDNDNDDHKCNHTNES